MEGVLIHADTVRSATLRHEVPLAIIDPFTYLEVDGDYIGEATEATFGVLPGGLRVVA